MHISTAATKHDRADGKEQMEKCITSHNRLRFVVLIIALSVFFFFFYGYDYHHSYVFAGSYEESSEKIDEHSCSGRYIYVHDLPPKFNDHILANCDRLYRFYNMCPYLTNSGFGAQVAENHEEIELGHDSWFATNQFLLEVIFRTRMNYYDCLTNDSSLASAIFVPYYGGLDVGRYLWDYGPERDDLGVDLVKWLEEKPEWKKMWGRDHFFIAGRVAFDFRRRQDDDRGWGSKLLSLPESMNITVLTIESTAWSNEFAIPYPTHFHPSSDREVIERQKTVRKHKRRYLFTFVGAPRPFQEDSIRSQIIKQCTGSGRLCNFLECESGPNKCDNPVEVIKAFQDSVFCLQPPGDTYTRRSAFDSVVAGCIPVFFHPGSAYAQYEWHLPSDSANYSVFIPGNLVKSGSINISETLLQVPKNRIISMREEVIKLIPKIIYANPKAKPESYEDAFDIAIDGVVERIENVRREIQKGKDPAIGFAEPSWKIKLARMGQSEEWLRFF